VYEQSYLAVPSQHRLGHRRTSSAPDFLSLTGQTHFAQQPATITSPLMYDSGNQWTAPHTTQGWASADLNMQYDQSVLPPAPDYQAYQAAPEAYSTYSSWSSQDTNTSSHSSHSGHPGLQPSMSVPDLSQYMNVPVHPVHSTHNPLTPRHVPQSLSIDGSSTFSSVPTMSSPNTPAYYQTEYVGPSADLSFQSGFGSLGINNHPANSPTLAPEYKLPKDNLVGLGISQQNNHTTHTTPTQRNPLQPSIMMDPSLSDQFYVAY